MIEPIMFAGIGFLVAGLLVIGVIPLVHARAVRLTMKRLEAITPMSMAEIQADKDQLRAEFAMSARRLEMSVDQLKAKTTNQLAEIGKKSDAIGRLKLDFGEKAAALAASEAREKQLTEDLKGAREEIAQRDAVQKETEARLVSTQDQLARASGDYRESSVTADSQRVELVALRAHAEVLTGQIGSYDKETRDLHERLNRVIAEAEAMNRQVAQDAAKTEAYAVRVTELEHQIMTEKNEADLLNRRIAELQARIAEQNRLLTERDYAADQLRNEALAAQKAEADVRAELAAAESRRHTSADGLRAEKALVEDQLRKSHDERAQLQREIEVMKREAETNWASERMENAVLRERINDVAAEVARLTRELEGPGSAIDAILAEDAHPAAAPNGHVAAAGRETAKGSLADRIRALQGRASRAVPGRA